MMRRRRYEKPSPDSSVIDEALDAMGAEDLRGLVRSILSGLDDSMQSRFTTELIARAARGEKRWTPSGPSDEDVAEVLVFAAARQRAGYADPSEVDDYLNDGMCAFLSRDYPAASRIFGALLPPLAEGEIDLGQHETADEVLGVNVADCAAQYVVAVYMTSASAQRADAVMAALNKVIHMGHFWRPLQELERVAVEPLPEFDAFLQAWRALVQDAAAGERSRDWDTDEDRWRREVVERLEGADGLAAVARSTRRSDDFDAWCRALVEAGDWEAALAAYVEAAETVTDKAYSRGTFLDGAALAAQELGRRDLPKRLERAWRTAPSLLRLRRWLGSSGTRATLRKRIALGLESCPEKAHRQRALLHVLLGDSAAAAKLLAAAPGLGWSDSEHPGHLLMPLFCRQLGGDPRDFELEEGSAGVRGMDVDELEWSWVDRDEPRLPNPSVEEVVKQAGIGAVDREEERGSLLKAMRTAARKRIEGVTKNKRRRYYAHAASLAAACVTLDGSGASADWLAAIRDKYRRFPALKREFERFGTGSKRV